MAMPTKRWIVLPTKEDLAGAPPFQLEFYDTLNEAKVAAIRQALGNNRQRIIMEATYYVEPTIPDVTRDALVLTIT